MWVCVVDHQFSTAFKLFLLKYFAKILKIHSLNEVTLDHECELEEFQSDHI